jgi:hypothetical protein
MLHVIILILIRPIIYQRPRVCESGLPIGISTRRELSRRTLAVVVIFSVIGPGEARTTDNSEVRTLRAALDSTGLAAKRCHSGDSNVSRAKPSVSAVARVRAASDERAVRRWSSFSTMLCAWMAVDDMATTGCGRGAVAREQLRLQRRLREAPARRRESYGGGRYALITIASNYPMFVIHSIVTTY